MKYRILEEDSRYKLQEQVEDLIKRGWRPQGGVYFVFNGSFSETWAQAMVKEND